MDKEKTEKRGEKRIKTDVWSLPDVTQAVSIPRILP